MTWTSDDKLQVHAWGISAVLHGLVVSLAMFFVAQIQPPPLKDVFEWEVSLVQSVVQEVKVESTKPLPSSPALRPQPKAIPPVEPVPQIVTREVQTMDKPTIIQRDVARVVEAVKPIENTAKPLERTVAVQERQVVTSEKQETKQAEVEERSVEQAVQAVVAQEPVITATAQPVITQAPVVGSVQPIETAATATPAHIQSASQVGAAVESSHEIVAQSSTAAAVEVPQASEQRAASVNPASQGAAISEAPVQVAKAAPQTSDVRADHRWVGESLWRRVAELKRYPSSARLNGLEGRVILKAVIRADGHLAEVVVVKSSGHAVLDAAAVEAVKMACPLHMKHPIGLPHIVVSLPIVYSLAN